MRALYIPLTVLMILLIASLWCSAHVQNRVDTWITQIEDISAALDDEHWDSLGSQILAAHRNWEHSQTLFHLILNHQDLEDAEKYFTGAMAACRERDSVELRIHLAQLISQLTFLSDTQEVTLRNIF